MEVPNYLKQDITSFLHDAMYTTLCQHEIYFLLPPFPVLIKFDLSFPSLFLLHALKFFVSCPHCHTLGFCRGSLYLLKFLPEYLFNLSNFLITGVFPHLHLTYETTCMCTQISGHIQCTVHCHLSST